MEKFSDNDVVDETENENATTSDGTMPDKYATERAKDAVAADNMTYHYKNESNEGTRVTYRCVFVKSRGQQCAASAYLLYSS